MSEPIAEESLVLPDGRTLCYTTFAAPSSSSSPQVQSEPDDRQTVFYFHGYPGTYHEGRPFYEAASKKGLRVVAITRPGFGGSTHQPDRSILSFVPDVLAVADHLHIDRFAVTAMSGGSPYALASLYAMPRERLLGAVIVSGLMPPSLGLDGMMLLNKIIFTCSPWIPTPMLNLVFDLAMGRSARNTSDPDKMARDLAASLESRPPEDVAAIHLNNDQFLKAMVESTRDAFCKGPEGAAWEAKLYSAHWGFELGELKEAKGGRLVLWHGGRDVNCPLQMTQKAAKMIPGAELRVEQDEAHISLIVNKVDEVVDTLVGMF